MTIKSDMSHNECEFLYDLALSLIILTYHDHDALMDMFVLVCLFGDTQSHGTSIAV